MIDKSSLAYWAIKQTLIMIMLVIGIIGLVLFAGIPMLVMWWKEEWQHEKARFLKQQCEKEVTEPSRTQWLNRMRGQFRRRK